MARRPRQSPLISSLTHVAIGLSNGEEKACRVSEGIQFGTDVALRGYFRHRRHVGRKQCALRTSWDGRLDDRSEGSVVALGSRAVV